VAGLAVIAVLIWRAGQYSPFAYRGGIGLLSVATAAVVAAAACPGSVVGLALGWRPLRWLGVRSYGIYLWHYPVIVLTSPANGTENLPRAALQTAASITLAALSWRFVEEPVRHGALGRLRRQARASRGQVRPAGAAGHAGPAGHGGLPGHAGPGGQVGWAGRVAGWTALASASGVLMVACAGLAGAFPAKTPGATAALTQSAAATVPQPAPLPPGSRPGGTGAPGSGPGRPGSGPGRGRLPAAGTRGARGLAAPGGGPVPSGGGTGGGPATTPEDGASPGAATAGGASLRTSCQQVFHIGDSTSEGLISPDYLPNPARRIPARYAGVGVRRTYTFVEGATSVVGTLPGTVNAYDAARRMVRRGYQGCWVIALGTNDTADVVVGSAVSRLARIERVMAVAHGQPVMWVDVKSLRASGPYAETYMRQWNAALAAACARYPNMRVFDWASVVKDRWFISDGIHYTSAGYAAPGQADR
jgi:GDSL-like Lipase/Acylhydrolase family